MLLHLLASRGCNRASEDSKYSRRRGKKLDFRSLSNTNDLCVWQTTSQTLREFTALFWSLKTWIAEQPGPTRKFGVRAHGVRVQGRVWVVYIPRHDPWDCHRPIKPDPPTEPPLAVSRHLWQSHGSCLGIVFTISRRCAFSAERIARPPVSLRRLGGPARFPGVPAPISGGDLDLKEHSRAVCHKTT